MRGLLKTIASLGLLLGTLTTVSAQEMEEGVEAPAFTLPGVRSADSEVTLADLQGQIVYVDFWASWCAPCLRSLPEVNTLYEKYKDQGFTVVAITIDDPVEDALEFLDDLETPLAYHVVLDRTAEVMDAYGVVGMPTSFLIGRDGNIRMVHKGFRAGDTELLEQALLTVLAE